MNNLVFMQLTHLYINIYIMLPATIFYITFYYFLLVERAYI